MAGLRAVERAKQVERRGTYSGGGIGCPECGDEYWDRAPGAKCDCGERLVEFSDTRKETS